MEEPLDAVLLLGHPVLRPQRGELRRPRAQARAFWADTMGWRVLQVWPYGNLTLASVLPPAQDDFHLEIPGGPGAAAQPQFGDVDASLAELRKRGVEIVNPAVRDR
ncbi:hypothetical protein [Amycolatopsis sp. NPDC003731]